ncbi:hypothetical protein [Streptomyces sp. NPDC086989]|uniref:hypothetical protein n=1 Tax=Streptomyces sp. NPDC086989 TaxID=3365764 RepID=UPI003819621D
MLKKAMSKAVAVAAAAPVLALTLAGSATASATANTVHWESARFPGKCLSWENDAFGNARLSNLRQCATSGPVDESQWREVSVDGKYWTFRPSRYATGGWTNMCLTSYNTLVYLETCQDGNWWQQWEEKWDGSNWRLQHRGAGNVAGYYLDTDGSRIYTEPGNNGLNQVWH